MNPSFCCWHLVRTSFVREIPSDMYAAEIFASLLPWPWSGVFNNQANTFWERIEVDKSHFADLMLEIIASHLQNMDFTVPNAKKTKPSCKSNLTFTVRGCILPFSFCDQGTVLHQPNAVSQGAHSFDKPAEFSKFTTV